MNQSQTGPQGQDSAQSASSRRNVERVQTGVRIEKRVLQVLKGLAEYLGISLGDLLEGICLHTFEGKLPFGEETLERIGNLRLVYDLDLVAEDSHLLTDNAPD